MTKFSQLAIGESFWSCGYLYEKTSTTHAVTLDSLNTQAGIRVVFYKNERVLRDGEEWAA